MISINIQAILYSIEKTRKNFQIHVVYKVSLYTIIFYSCIPIHTVLHTYFLYGMMNVLINSLEIVTADMARALCWFIVTFVLLLVLVHFFYLCMPLEILAECQKYELLKMFHYSVRFYKVWNFLYPSYIISIKILD